MLAYQVKTYERFFWKFYKEAFKKSVKGFFRADEHLKGEFLNYFKYLQAHRVAYSFDTRKNAKWGEFMMQWVRSHTLEVWTTGFVFHYHKEEPQSTPAPNNARFTNEDDKQALLAYLDALSDYPLEEQALDRVVAAYEACTNDCQRSWLLAASRWAFRVSPADIYDELAL